MSSELEPNEPEHQSCANCGEKLSGYYCAHCGQRDEPLRQPIGRFLKEAFTEMFGVDGRLWRSLGLLIARPGRLTNQYLKGHRVRFIRPLRLYLIASLVFFFLLSVIDPVAKVNFGDDVAAADTSVRVADYQKELQDRIASNARRIARQEALVDSLEIRYVADSLALIAARLTAEADTIEVQADSLSASPDDAEFGDLLDELEDELDDLQDDRDDERSDLWRMRRNVSEEARQIKWKQAQLAGAQPDSLIRPADINRAAELIFEDAPGSRVNVNLPDWWPESESIRQMRAARTDQEMMQAIASFFRDFLRRLPMVMFLLLPMFALLLKVLYFRRAWYYSEHLVFGLHTHAFAFIIFTLMLLVSSASGEALWAEIASAVILFIIPIYFYIAQKRVYGQGWFKTLLKASLLSWMYFFVLMGGAIIALLLASAR